MCPFYRIIVKGTFIPVFLAGECDVGLHASRQVREETRD
jgi:hypothetical protein